MSFEDEIIRETPSGVARVSIGNVCDEIVDLAHARVALLSADDRAQAVVLITWGDNGADFTLRFARIGDIEREWAGAAPLTLATIYCGLQAGQVPVVFDDGIANNRGDGASVCTLESYRGDARAPWEDAS